MKNLTPQQFNKLLSESLEFYSGLFFRKNNFQENQLFRKVVSMVTSCYSMGKFSFLFLLSFFLLLCVSAKLTSSLISPATSISSKEDLEKDKSEKIETGSEEKNGNEGKVKPGEFILTHITNFAFLHQSKISYLKNNPNLPTTYSKVLQQPPKNF